LRGSCSRSYRLHSSAEEMPAGFHDRGRSAGGGGLTAAVCTREGHVCWPSGLEDRRVLEAVSYPNMFHARARIADRSGAWRGNRSRMSGCGARRGSGSNWAKPESWPAARTGTSSAPCACPCWTGSGRREAVRTRRASTCALTRSSSAPSWSRGSRAASSCDGNAHGLAGRRARDDLPAGRPGLLLRVLSSFDMTPCSRRRVPGADSGAEDRRMWRGSD
jgi:hypothetical protein